MVHPLQYLHACLPPSSPIDGVRALNCDSTTQWLSSYSYMQVVVLIYVVFFGILQLEDLDFKVLPPRRGQLLYKG